MNKIILLIFCFLWSANVNLFSQTKEDSKFKVLGNVKSLSEVQLRFAPSDYKLYEKIKSSGIILRRGIKSINGVDLSLEDFGASVVILDTIKPYSLTTLYAQNWAAELKLAVDSLLYNPSNNYILPQNATLGQAIRYDEAMQEKFLISILLSEQNFDASRALALGYTDDTGVLANREYEYTFSLQGDTSAYSDISIGSIVVNTANGASPYIAPTDVSGEGGDLKATLMWSVEQTKNLYTFYNVYRSDNNGVSFTKVNGEPFIFISTEKITNDINYYTDSLPANNTAYQYYIKGINAFGNEGAASSIITVTGKKDRMLVNFAIDTFAIVLGNTIALKWDIQTGFHPEDTSRIISFTAMYGAKRDAPPMPIAGVATFSKNTRQATIPYIGDGFYYMRMTDNEGYHYLTLPKMIQKPDTIAPAIPTNLVATIDNDRKLTLKWNKNTEADLIGYKVYYAYKADGPFLETNNGFVKDNAFFETIDEENANKSMYYKVSAVDKVQNISEMSALAMVGLPDNDGPSAPILSSVVPRPEGIRIAWRVGKDAAKFTLQRKLQSQSKWTDVLIEFKDGDYPLLPLAPQEMTPSNYVDNSPLLLKQYDYRLVAKDEAGRTTASRKVTVKPYDDGIRGTIQNFTAVLMPPNQTYTDYQGPILNDTGSGQVVTVKPDGVVAKIRWDYNTNFSASLREFKIYIKDDIPQGNTDGDISPTYTLVETITKHYATGTAQAIGVSGYATYIERIQFRKNLPKKIKILAIHNDGGFSYPVEITLNPN